MWIVRVTAVASIAWVTAVASIAWVTAIAMVAVAIVVVSVGDIDYTHKYDTHRNKRCNLHFSCSCCTVLSEDRWRSEVLEPIVQDGRSLSYLYPFQRLVRYI